MTRVFVTVGTTKFDELIENVISEENVKVLIDRGYTELTLQVGHGSHLPSPGSCSGLKMDAFRFKDSISDDMKQADLVISHAGAGSCLEALGAQKALLVVVNDKLMDNHQLELARQLHSNSHLLYCTCSTLTETLKTMDFSTLMPFLPGQPQNFAKFLDKALGIA
ncbi:UDP-N-acetylglucosamine transferase subunit ALG13 homolog [Clupea harengus]|uniref:UDP-N-acetylglucosamine transferase subunit ALG13 n=1 Tax=Clupea harengus TaxID=7950 RepID=A0A6P3WEB2_CLUHA|nr:UDP-N-acetylglucosamine transferase subunit ALG13 homolog [Clupea harengus]XP_042558676.1 UDP-N-acetylglucosamine transferase subunit ALG13 homolog [Clupea harengus]